MINILESVVPILNLDDLKIISPLGRGAKGLVFLVQEQQYGQIWALKVILRDLIEKKDKDEYKRVCFEQQVLSRLNHPLLPSLRGVLATDKIVGYAIDFCPGRDLNQLRKQQSERMFSVDIIRFYAAELVLVLEYLHNLGIVYRDLKPENILIQENGHIMLVDFDLSTKISPNSGHNPPPSSPNSTAESHLLRRKCSILNCLCNSRATTNDSFKHNTSSIAPESDPTEKSNSFVGTEEYVAPEIIQGHGHEFAVDWWSLGIVLYEMLYGTTPFKGSNKKETFLRILSTAPDLVGEATPLRDLIQKLLVKDPTGRIKLREIKGHNFFQGVDWDLILHVSRPPYIPAVSREFTAEDGKEEIMKTDLESFVERIFGEDLIKIKRDYQNKEVDNIHEQDKRDWVKGIDNSYENNNFLVF